jgi:DNA-binding GntR family transcriptional regulator
MPWVAICLGCHMRVQPVDPYRQVPSYVQVADDVARRIDSGGITRRLPSELALAEEYEVSCGTVRHGMAMLRERGLIVTIHGRGTFVAASMPLTA